MAVCPECCLLEDGLHHGHKRVKLAVEYEAAKARINDKRKKMDSIQFELGMKVDEIEGGEEDVDDGYYNLENFIE